MFYTAYGHDERVWGNAMFHKLILNAIRWAVQPAARRAELLHGAPAGSLRQGMAGRRSLAKRERSGAWAPREPRRGEGSGGAKPPGK